METNNEPMKYLFLLITIALLGSCQNTPKWTDDMEKCLADPEVELLHTALTRFERVLNEKATGETLTDKYKYYLKEVERIDLLPEYYHHLLIKETTKKMLFTDFYEQMWQQSSQWVLNDGKGTPVYIINGFGGVPTCLGKTGANSWLKNKLESYKKPVNPVPSLLARELLNNLTPEDYEIPQVRAFIALSLCYQQSVAYYDKETER